MTKPLVVFPDAQLAVVQLLRTKLAARTDSVATGAVVGTMMPDGKEPSPRSAPYIMVRLDGTSTRYPVDETADMRVAVWHSSEAKSLALAQLCRALLLAHAGSEQIRVVSPLTGPIPASDPESGDPLSSFTVAVRLRPNPL
jgi:hypothetical protein